MGIVYSDMDVPEDSLVSHSLFLAGPTPRSFETPSWRPEALEILSSINYNGMVFVPERRNWKTLPSYTHQVEWEERAIAYCKVLVFWVPRRMDIMPGLTTNVEFGRWIMKKPKSISYGRPDDAEHCRYLDWIFLKETGKTPERMLKETLTKAINQ